MLFWNRWSIKNRPGVFTSTTRSHARHAARSPALGANLNGPIRNTLIVFFAATNQRQYCSRVSQSSSSLNVMRRRAPGLRLDVRLQERFSFGDVNRPTNSNGSENNDSMLKSLSCRNWETYLQQVTLGSICLLRHLYSKTSKYSDNDCKGGKTIITNDQFEFSLGAVQQKNLVTEIVAL